MLVHDVAYYRARAEKERAAAVSQALKSFGRWVVAPAAGKAPMWPYSIEEATWLSTRRPASQRRDRSHARPAPAKKRS